MYYIYILHVFTLYIYIYIIPIKLMLQTGHWLLETFKLRIPRTTIPLLPKRWHQVLGLLVPQ